MALVSCKECGGKLSAKAVRCPHCGAPRKRRAPGCLSVLGYAVLALLFISILHDASKRRDQAAAPVASARETATPAKPRPPAPPKVEAVTEPPVRVLVHDLRCEQNSLNMFEAIGEVQNLDRKPISSVRLVIGFYDVRGRLIDKAEAMADIRPLLYGQRSPFKTYGPTNPEVSQCDVVAVKDGPFGDQLRFEKRSAAAAPAEPARSGRDPMQFYRCPAPDGSLSIQDRPCS